MKLRKALDKAKDERGFNEKPVVHENITKKIKDSKPHEYTQTRNRPLDPEVTERNRGVCMFPNPDEIERYKILRTRINHKSADRPINTVMITSPHRGEGKTVTCINMGFTFARELNHTVVLVDCDFTGQDIHRYLGIESKLSLIDYLLDDVPLNDLLIWPGVDKLTLISGDRTVLDSSELLSSDMMARLVKEMGSRYDDRYVFFDAPPVLERSEAISMAPFVDGILMVVAAGVTSKRDVQRAVALLPEDKFLGFVLNKQE